MLYNEALIREASGYVRGSFGDARQWIEQRY